MNEPSRSASSTIEQFLGTLVGSSTRAQRRTYLHEYLHYLRRVMRCQDDELSIETFLDEGNIRAWLSTAQQGFTRRRSGVNGPRTAAAPNSMAARITTINTFSRFCGYPVDLPRPKCAAAGRLSRMEAHRTVRLLARHPPPRMAVATWERSVAIVALAVCTRHCMPDLHAMRLHDVELRHTLPRVRVAGQWYPLDAFTRSVLTRWLVTRRRLMSAAGGGPHGDGLWVTTRPLRPHRGHRTPERALPATLRTLVAAHRNLTLRMLGVPLRLEQFCAVDESGSPSAGRARFPLSGPQAGHPAGTARFARSTRRTRV